MLDFLDELDILYELDGVRYESGAWALKVQIISLRRILSRLGKAQASLAFRSLLQNLAPKGCTFRERFGDGVGASGSVSQTGSVRIRSVGAQSSDKLRS